jgi:sensor histidine kinase YesM
VLIEYYFLSRILKARFSKFLTLLGIAVVQGLVNYININCGLYKVFPQQVFFLVTTIFMVMALFQSDTGKKVMIAIFMDGLGYTSSFIFLPLIQYTAKRVVDNYFLFDLLYSVCDILTLLFFAGVLEWVARKYRHLQGEITIEGNFYLLILSCFVKYSVIYYGTSRMSSDNSLWTNILISLVAITGVILLLFSLYYVDRRLVLALEKQQNLFLERQMAAWKEEEKQLSSFRHDFKNHMLCIKNLITSGKSLEAGEYLNSITHTVNSLSPHISTGNVYADAIIREKIIIAQAEGIDLETDLIFPSSELLAPMDLCIILSNALDNALEACTKLSKEEIKTIQAVSYVRHSCLMIEIKNPIPWFHVEKSSIFQSTKKNSRLHGIGLTSIHQAVERCHGILELTAKDNVFHFSAMLPLTQGDLKSRLHL